MTRVSLAFPSRKDLRNGGSKLPVSQTFDTRGTSASRRAEVIMQFSEIGKIYNRHTSQKLHLPVTLALGILEDAPSLTYGGWLHFHRTLAMEGLRNATLRNPPRLRCYVLMHKGSYGTGAQYVIGLATRLLQIVQNLHHSQLRKWHKNRGILAMELPRILQYSQLRDYCKTSVLSHVSLPKIVEQPTINCSTIIRFCLTIPKLGCLTIINVN